MRKSLWNKVASLFGNYAIICTYNGENRAIFVGMDSHKTNLTREWRDNFMESVITFGCGSYYQKKENYFKRKYKIIAFLDNNMRESSSYCSVPVYHPSNVSLLPSVPIFIMTSIRYYTDIFSQLLMMGIPEERIFFGANELPATNMVEEMMKQVDGRIVSQNGRIAIDVRGKIFPFSNENEYKDVIRCLRKFANPLARCLINMPIQQGGKDFGGEFGTPIDRYYIEKFLSNHRQYITGDVLEIAEDTYTYRFGHDIRNSYKLHVDGDDGCLKGNLVTGEGIEENMVDCFICTQTLQFVYDIHGCMKNIHRLLRPGGDCFNNCTWHQSDCNV